MKNTIFAFVLVFAVLLTGGCNQTDEHGSAPASAPDQQRVDSEKDSHQMHGNSKEDFLEYLESGKALSSFFSDHWTLVYHEDNRCDGSTDGEATGLARAEIDKTIEIKVKNDGKSWLEDCGEKTPREFDLNFNLKELVSNWDRFEIPDWENQMEGVVYIIGSGESDYLVLHYGDDNLIVKMEYRSEDPG
ncbi:MAG: hypothetical protein LBV45_06335 [Xanthomonadaceae bacterium]|nr:hypothetical protein [Xanthomonadaceae bacterium]